MKKEPGIFKYSVAEQTGRNYLSNFDNKPLPLVDYSVIDNSFSSPIVTRKEYLLRATIQAKFVCGSHDFEKALFNAKVYILREIYKEYVILEHSLRKAIYDGDDILALDILNQINKMIMMETDEGSTTY